MPMLPLSLVTCGWASTCCPAHPPFNNSHAIFLSTTLPARRYADGPRYYSEPQLLGFSLAPFSHPDIDSGAAAGPGYPPPALLALHLAALQHQLAQLYAAAAAAVALGRVLLLPQLQCFCYRDPDSGRHGPAPWLAAADGSSSSSSGWSCRAPGDDASQMPFNCTLDQVRPLICASHDAA